MVARKGQDLVTEARCRFTQGYGAPFDATQLVAAYELALAAPSPLLAGAAAAALASGGTDDQRDAWLQRAESVIGPLDELDDQGELRPGHGRLADGAGTDARGAGSRRR